MNVAAETEAPAAPLVALRGISKTYGATRANDGIDLQIRPGEVIGLVGGNGAGKSTLVKILCGAVPPTEGEILLDGVRAPAGHTAAAAQAHGIRMVHQELSLCTNLTVAENFFVEAPRGARPLPGWRAPFRARAQAALDAVFPDHGIDPGAEVGRLALGERQMVEIARAAATPGVRLIILDEPTSSLSARRAAQLIAFVHSRAAQGMAFIYISHKLREITEIASAVALLRNGRLVWHGRAGETSVGHLIDLMGGRDDGARADRAATAAAVARAAPVMHVGAPWSEASLDLHAGEIVALAGLEGSGQQAFLHAALPGPVRGDTPRPRRLRRGRPPEGGRLPSLGRAVEHLGRAMGGSLRRLARRPRRRSRRRARAFREASARPCAAVLAHRGTQRRQPAEGAGRPRARGRRADHPARRSDARRGRGDQAGLLPPPPRPRRRGPHHRLVHDRGCRA
jgi:ABC-type multidrug transport system ATPase subunit